MSEAAKQQVGMGLDCYSPEELTAPVVQKNLIISKVPSPDSPLVFKLVPDLLKGKVNGKLFEYYEVFEHGHVGGTDKTGKPIIYYHPCQKSLGSKTCPECDRYWSEKERLKLAGETSDAGKAIKRVTDILTPKRKAWINIVLPGGDVVKAIKIPTDVLNKLWGKAKTAYKDAIPSLISDMRSKAISPFDLKAQSGWISLSKTGEGLGTTYHVGVAVEKKPLIENGVNVGMVDRFVMADVSTFLFTGFNLENLPDFRKLEQQRAFTMAESEEFAKNPFVTPQRILDMFKKDTVKAADADEGRASGQSTAVEQLISEISPAAATQLSSIDEAL